MALFSANMALFWDKFAFLGEYFDIFWSKLAVYSWKMVFSVLKWHFWAKNGTFGAKMALFRYKFALLGEKNWHFLVKIGSLWLKNGIFSAKIALLGVLWRLKWPRGGPGAG